MTHKVLTPRQVARAIGVSDASLKRWCDRGLIPCVRTVGGHRRLPIEGVLQFLRSNGHALVRPEILGLPPNTGRGGVAVGRSIEMVRGALESGDEEKLRHLVFSLYLAGHTARDICDKVLAPAFHAVGVLWYTGRLEIYQERRACEVCLRVLYQLMSSLPPPGADAPAALGGTLRDDPYTLPTTMAELALREIGWRAESCGAGLPASTLCAAIEARRPRLIWLSVSHIASTTAFLENYESLYRTASAQRIAVVIGGAALNDAIRRQIHYSAYCDNLSHLVAFAEALEGHSNGQRADA